MKSPRRRRRPPLHLVHPYRTQRNRNLGVVARVPDIDPQSLLDLLDPELGTAIETIKAAFESQALKMLKADIGDTWMINHRKKG